MNDLIASACHDSAEDLSPSNDNECKTCTDSHPLLKDIKANLKVCSRQEKLRLLTLGPKSWPIAKTCKEFLVSQYKVKMARKLRKEKGILGIPEAKKRVTLTEGVKEQVLRMYESDNFTRLCPRKKDCVSVYVNGEKVRKQKRLIITRLRELYAKFKSIYSTYRIGFSTCCELRRTLFVNVSSSSSHSVSVCCYHQTTKVMCSAFRIRHDYASLMELSV